MDIHQKINRKQKRLVKHYIDHVCWFDFTKNFGFKYMPKYLRYGGYRNTCYDFRDKREM